MKVVDNGQEREKTFATVRVDQDLSELLEKHNVTFKGVIESNLTTSLSSTQ